MNPRVIVCAVELPPRPGAALAHALELSRWYQADLHVVYVRPGRSRRRVGDVSPDDAVRMRLSNAVASMATDGVSVQSVVLTGDPVRALAEYARRQSADLVVLGETGRRASRYWTSGAFAAAVGGAVECPTIAVPSAGAAPVQPSAPFRTIMCAIDSSLASLPAFDRALALAQESAGRLILLHVLEGFPYETVYSGARALRLIHEYRRHVENVNRDLRALVPPEALNWCEVEAVTMAGFPGDAIPAIAAQLRAEVIVLGLPRRPRLEHLVRGSTVRKVLRRAGCPVLIVPASTVTAAATRAAMGEPVLQREVTPLTRAAGHVALTSPGLTIEEASGR